MRHIKLFKKALLLLGLIVSALSVEAYDFQYTYEGKTVIYTVLDEYAKTCETKRGEYGLGITDYAIPGNNITGTLVLPANPKDGGVEYTLTTIGDYGFANAKDLTNVIIPSSVTSIGKGAFRGCNSLTKVSIPNSVTHICDDAFCMCTNLTKATIPNSVTSIGSMAFFGCESLAPIEIPNSVTTIEEYTFAYCTSQKTITIPNSVTSIGSCAFWGCKSLTEVTIPNSVTSIGSNAFRECESLTEVIIPNSVTSIEHRTFLFCSALTEVTIPSSVTSIGESAFEECNSLTEVTIHNLVTNLGKGAFSKCSNLKKFYFNAENCSGKGPWLSESPIEEVIIGESVKSIPDYAFSECNSLPVVTIPGSVTSIGNSAFSKCSNLKKINYNAENCSIGSMWLSESPIEEVFIGETVKSISDDAFYDCDNLTKVNTPSIENWLKISFGNKYSNPIYHTKNLLVNGETIRRLTIPEGTKHINSNAFVNYASLVSVNMPSSLESIGDEVFVGCTGLQRIIFPSEKKFLKLTYQSEKCKCTYGNDARIYIGSEPFAYSNIDWPKDLTRIPDYAFYDVEEVSSINIPNTVEYIGKYAFYNCRLTEIAIPSSVTHIGDYAFKCPDLKSVILDNINSWSRMQFENETQNPIYFAGSFRMAGSEKPVEHLVLDMPGEEVSAHAFRNARNLKTVRINAASVGTGSFSGCDYLSDLCLNVDNIGSKAFNGNYSMNNVYSMTATPPTALDDAFSLYDRVKLYVPAGARSKYENADNCWWRFFDVYESDFSDIDSIFKADHASGVEGIIAGPTDFIVTTGGGFISVAAADSDFVTIYNLQGVSVHSGYGSVMLNVNPNIYIVKVGNNVKKVAVN